VTPATGLSAAARGRVLFTRFVRRRNFAGYPFWVSASPEACSALSARAREYATAEGFDTGVRLADLPPDKLGLHREGNILPEHPVAFAGKRDFKAVFTGTRPGEYALFGEVEHWTRLHIVADAPGIEAMPATIPVHPPFLETPFARSATYGYLTSNPTFAGAGLQIEVALHLPALAADRRPGQGLPAVQQLQRALGAMGFDLQPLSLRTPGSAESGYFRMTSRGGMDFPEELVYEHFAVKADIVLTVEAEALARWHRTDPNRLEDRVHRALRLLQEARRMEYSELLSLTSFARIGTYLGIFPEKLRFLLETLRLEAQPFHLRHRLEDPEFSGGGPASEALEPARAALARRLTTGVEPVSATGS
jgi:hypothetical protein